ncbi:MAG: hypothetical protein LBG23_00765 [Endomicrobium sp.]|jgi:hypothetical protein|nr:hypothetical protein [Endomicrobium sp.]
MEAVPCEIVGITGRAVHFELSHDKSNGKTDIKFDADCDCRCLGGLFKFLIISTNILKASFVEIGNL